ncbi:MAG: hypothetical protein QW666_00290 [Candidatus Woesearchaeota archaeon]
MAFTRDLRIKITPLQYEIIKNKAQVSGYKSVSAFIRDSVLKEDYSTEELIKQIHEIVVKEKKKSNCP